MPCSDFTSDFDLCLAASQRQVWSWQRSWRCIASISFWMRRGLGSLRLVIQALQSYKSSQVLEIASAVCTFWLQRLISASIESHRKSGSAPKCPTILSSAWMFCYGWGYQVNLPPKRNGLGLTWVRLALRCLVQPLTCGMKSVLVCSSDCGCKTYLGGSTVLWQWVLKDQKKSSDVSMDSGCYI